MNESASPDASQRGPLLTMTGMTKQYPGCLANDHVSLTVERNQIHALLGENGAGKSTLVKIIYGVVKPMRARSSGKARRCSSRTPAMRNGWASAWCSSTSRCSKR